MFLGPGHVTHATLQLIMYADDSPGSSRSAFLRNRPDLLRACPQIRSESSAMFFRIGLIFQHQVQLGFQNHVKGVWYNTMFLSVFRHTCVFEYPEDMTFNLIFRRAHLLWLMGSQQIRESGDYDTVVRRPTKRFRSLRRRFKGFDADRNAAQGIKQRQTWSCTNFDGYPNKWPTQGNRSRMVCGIRVQY